MVTPARFGELPDGRPVTAYPLVGDDGTQLTVLDLGATVQRLRAFADGPGGAGGVDVVLGFPDLAGYLADPAPYFGAVVGRYANRLAGSSFVLDGQTHHVTSNEGATCLHGGPGGFHRQLWEVTAYADAAITLELVSPDGDQGFPGRLVATATYTVGPGLVTIDLAATTDAPTVVNLTNHAYFNLAGEGIGSVDGHLLTVDADAYLPIDDESIPVGHAADVQGTPFDLTLPVLVGDRARDPHEQIGAVGGIDHAFQLRGEGLRRAARLEDPASGRVLEVHTDQPALQVYTGNSLDGSIVGRGGSRYRQGDGIALETQRHPDAPNQPWLPSAVLRPGETYRSVTQWRLGRS